MTYPLPSGWQEFKLKDIGFFLRGSGISKKDLSDTGTPAIRYGDIYTKYNFVIKDISSYTNSKGTEIKKGDILFTGSGETAEEIGKSVAFIDDYKALAGGDIIIFRPNIDLNSIFLSYILNFGKCRKDISIMGQGHTVVHIYASSLEILKVILPPLDEQKRIAEVLSLCDDVIENLTELIEKKEQYKKGVMQRLLSGEVRFKGFTDEWQKYKLLDIGISYSGLTNKNASNFIDNCNAKYVTYKSIYDSNKIDINRLEDVFVEKDEKQNLVQYGDAFFTISSETPDEVAISSVLLDKVDNTYLNSFCFGFRFDFNILLPEFARYYFRSNYIRKYTYKLSQGSTRFNLSKNKFLEMIINIPSIEEQKKIAGLLSLIDEEIENLKKQLELRKQQKKGLMQKLLTGEVRI